MDFTAIDFETATSEFTSVCSLGWCVVRDNQIVRREEILIRPEPFKFNDYNIKIHGIKPNMVADKPTFDGYWERVKPDIENQIVVAHNASFDVRVLCQTLKHFGLEIPEFTYFCTVNLSQKAYPELESHRLNRLCEALGVHFNHHQAYDDAYACARVMLRIAEDYSLESFEEIEECFDIKRGEVHPGMDFSTKKRKPHRRRKIHIKDKKE